MRLRLEGLGWWTSIGIAGSNQPEAAAGASNRERLRVHCERANDRVVFGGALPVCLGAALARFEGRTG